MEHLLDALLTAFIPAAAVLLAAALYCLLPGRVACKRKARRALGWVLALFLAVSLLQLAGEFTLAMFGLAWRAWVRSLFAGALGLLTFLGVFQILGCYLEQRDTPRLAHQIVVGVSGLVVIAYLATVGLSNWFLSLRPERTVAWRDRTLVEEDRGFLDPFYVYYEYHGPLVRGARSVDYHGPLVRGARSVDVGVPYGECLQEDE